MQCRPNCGACCIAPFISQPFKNMPTGKAAGERCANLAADQRCTIWGTEDYPEFCKRFLPDPLFCGDTNSQALKIITEFEQSTQP